jgi:DNA-binding MarR family transcriptional regulator
MAIKELLVLRKALRLLRDLDDSMSLQVALGFVTVAAATPDPVSSFDLCEALDIVGMGPTRITDSLTDRGRRGRGKPGLGLIRDEIDPEDRRSRLYSLSPHGLKVAKQLGL